MRAARFVGVGVVGFAVQLAVMASLTRAGIHYSIAAALGVEAAILQNFVWHECWTWRDRRQAGQNRLIRLIRFNAATGATSIVGNVFLTMALVETLHWPAVAANVVAVVALSIVNFNVVDRLVFTLERAEVVRLKPDTTTEGVRSVRR
jgi:putative flippase GtrA